MLCSTPFEVMKTIYPGVTTDSLIQKAADMFATSNSNVTGMKHHQFLMKIGGPPGSIRIKGNVIDEALVIVDFTRPILDTGSAGWIDLYESIYNNVPSFSI